MSKRKNRIEKLDLRLTASARRVLQGAAQASNKTVSGFVLQSALERAEDLPANRPVFRLNTRRWNAFMAALDAPAKLHPRLVRLLTEPSVFD
jgi:uncharacterized protein (DUF1778 family)